MTMKNYYITKVFENINVYLYFVVSNPPPSPEAAEKSPEYSSLPINLVNTDAVEEHEKPSTSHDTAVAKELQTYEDDFLDVNCGDMDFF